MKMILKFLSSLLLASLLISCNKTVNDLNVDELDGIFAISTRIETPTSKGADDYSLIRYVELGKDEITVFYELKRQQKEPSGNGGLNDELITGNPGGAQIHNGPLYFVSTDEADNGLRFECVGSKIITDIFSMKGQLETLRIEENYYDEIVLLAPKGTIFELNRITDPTKTASLRIAPKATLKEIEDYVEYFLNQTEN